MSDQPGSVNNSIAAIAAGFGAFFSAGAVAFGLMYVVFLCILPKPDVFHANSLWSSLVGAAVGSAVGGYVIARVARHNQFIPSVVVMATLVALGWWYTQPYPDWATIWFTLLVTILVYLPLLVLGIWMGSRKRKQIERSV
jgi:hypothetical protein